MFQNVLLQAEKILLLKNFSQFNPSVNLRNESVSENLGHFFRSGTLIITRYIQLKVLKTDNSVEGPVELPGESGVRRLEGRLKRAS